MGCYLAEYNIGCIYTLPPYRYVFSEHGIVILMTVEPCCSVFVMCIGADCLLGILKNGFGVFIVYVAEQAVVHRHCGDSVKVLPELFVQEGLFTLSRKFRRQGAIQSLSGVGSVQEHTHQLRTGADAAFFKNAASMNFDSRF